LTKHNKKLTQPEHLTLSSQAAQPLDDAAVQSPEAASLEAAVRPVSAVSSVPAGPSASAAGMPAPKVSNKVTPTPEGVGDWRGHVFFFWLSIVGTVGTLGGIVLSVFLYQVSQIEPLLTFAVHPLKTELQRPDYDKELGFIYKGKPVESASITSVQVSIWNAGTRSIRDSDILDPFRLVMADGAAILSVRVKKTSRPICGFELVDDQEDYKSGTCRLKWRILEPGDGAVLQIIYASSARRDPTLEGAVEGQKDGVVVQQYDLTPDRTAILSKISMTRLGVFLVGLLVIVFLMLIANKIHAKSPAAKKLAEERAEAEKLLAELRKRTVPAPPVFWILLVFALLLAFGILGLLLFGSSTGPPFGW
jgi:hypothetical protein